MIFGDKEIFAIELGETKHPKKFFLRLWLKGMPKGNFKKSAPLADTITDYQTIVKKKESLYLPVFDLMGTEEVFAYTTKFNFRLDEDERRYDETKHLGRHAFLAPQFTNTQSSSVVLYKDPQLRLIWRNDFGEPVNDAVVPFDYFCKVFDEFICYCKDKGAV